MVDDSYPNAKFLQRPRRLERRQLTERVFRAATLSAVGLSIGLLALIVFSLVSLSLTAATHHRVFVTLSPTLERVLPPGTTDVAEVANNIAAFDRLLADEIHDSLGQVEQREPLGLFSPLAVSRIASKVARDPDLLGTAKRYSVPISSGLDSYLKGGFVDETVLRLRRADVLAHPLEQETGFESRYKSSILSAVRGDLTDPRVGSSGDPPSIFLETGSAVLKVSEFGSGDARFDLIAGRLADGTERARVRIIWTPEAQRAISDEQIALANHLKATGIIRSTFNGRVLTAADSTYPELAGVLGALVGSLLTLLITALMAVPIGVMAAIWLEEFAMPNRMTETIEVNINNLAAVPSIVFGLLGAAVLLNLLSLPRSAPIAGGLVLAFLTLPTVIIASRAALRAVSDDLRTAALSLGASRMQMVVDHVLPSAAPGILTGVILGLARSLGETAPLLLIGMFVFVGEVPTGIGDDATTLPVIIYKWSTGAERAWEPLTAAAVVLLLVILVIINVLTSYLRQRFEK